MIPYVQFPLNIVQVNRWLGWFMGCMRNYNNPFPFKLQVSLSPCIPLHSSPHVFGVRPRNPTYSTVFSTLQFTLCHLNKRICLAQWKRGCLVKFRHVLRRWCSHLHIRIWTQPLLLQSVFPLHLWLLSSGVPHQHLSKRKIISIVHKGIVDPFQKGLGKIQILRIGSLLIWVGI